MAGNSAKYLKKNHVSLHFTFYLFYLQNEKVGIIGLFLKKVGKSRVKKKK